MRHHYILYGINKIFYLPLHISSTLYLQSSMGNLFTSLVFIMAFTVIAPDNAQAAPTTPTPGVGQRARTGLFGKALKKRRPPVLPYERALRRKELFR
ncbi:hypothetical protein [Hymenobacter glacieicola]|uniref:hypothetical protein n=1 Tax=Hymenobacter glacieicola TaxID=1562124 RepID=UPI001E549FC5|nr:hypothetical protein [Hymenobacter glacieicola]